MKLPAVSPRNWGDLILNFQVLQSWLGRIGDVAQGAATLNFPTANLATEITVVHGLGRTPQRVLATLQGTVLPRTATISVYCGVPTGTTFLLGAHADAVLTGNVDVTWLALG